MKDIFWLLVLIITCLSVSGFIFSPILLGYAFLLWRFILIPYCAFMLLYWVFFGFFDSKPEVMLESHYDFEDGKFLDISLSCDGVQYFLNYTEDGKTDNVAIFDSLPKVSEFMRDRFGVDLSI